MKPTGKQGILCVLLTTGIMLAALQPAAALQPESGTRLIARAYSDGTIDLETYVVQKLKSYFDPAAVDPRFRSTVLNEPTREITPLLALARQYWDSFSPETIAFLTPLFKRPTDPTHSDADLGGLFNFGTTTVKTFTTEHFKLHYTSDNATDGGGNRHNVPAADSDGNGTPDYVENMGGVFEWCYRNEITSLGYDAPPQDNGDAAHGGDTKFDIYILNTGKYSIFGFASPEDAVDTTGDKSNESTSWMAMDNDMVEFTAHTPLENTQVTAAHEFHHAVQFGYNVNASAWYMEATATWMEDQVYDAVNDNRQYINGRGCADFFYNPEVSLDYSTSCAGGDHWYGTWVFNEYLETKWDQAAIKNAWQNLDPKDKDSGVDAIAAVIQAKGSTLKDTFTDFVAKNYSQKGFYKDALFWDDATGFAPGPFTLDYSTATSHKVDEKTTTVKHLASKYYRFKPGVSLKKPAILTIKVNGADGKDVNAIAIAKRKDGSFVEYPFSLDDTTKEGEVGVGGFSSQDMIEVTLAVLNYSKTEDGLEIKYQASLKKGFTFVIDSTGSMGDEIESAKAAARRVLDENKANNLDRMYTLLTFADGAPVTRGQSSDEDTMKTFINTVGAGGGNGCPESSLLSIRTAARLSEGSDILMMTDASSNSYGVDNTKATWGEVYETINLLLETNSRLNSIIYGDCGGSFKTRDRLLQCPDCASFRTMFSLGDPSSSHGRDAYTLISVESGGLAFNISSSDTEAAAEMILRSGATDSTLAIYDGEDNGTFSVPVDSSVSSLQLIANPDGFTGPVMRVTAPDGTAVDNDTAGVNVLVAGGTTYYIIDPPALAPGEWSVATAGSGTYRFSAEAATTNAMAYTGDTDIAAGGTLIMEATFRNAVSNPGFQLVSLDGRETLDVSLSDEGGNTYRGSVVLDSVTSYRFRVIADGSFQRMHPATISVTEIGVAAPLSRKVLAGTSLTYTFQVRNLGAEEDTLDLYSSTTHGWADLSGVPTSITLAPGETQNISVPVTVPDDAESGDIDTVALQAVSQASPLVSATGKTETAVVALFDFDGDADVDDADLQMIVELWNLTAADDDYDATFDLDGDGDIDIADIMQVSAQLGIVIEE